MNRTEALELLSYVALDRSPDAADVRQIGNGEHVVVLKNPFTYLWAFGDYTTFRQDEEATRSRKVASR